MQVAHNRIELLVGTDVLTVQIEEGKAKVADMLLKDYIKEKVAEQLTKIDQVMKEKRSDFKRILLHYMTSGGRG